ncbi:MAG: PIN domain-containing protein [Propionibacteriaceae bacterium]|nr:PIN domain-containing protein [Propionibacteriaceae bacterium]
MKPPPAPEGRPVRIYVADANVLYSRSLRDYLLYAMRARLIAVRWSGSILAEVVEHLMENRSGFTAESGQRLVRAVNVTFPHAQVDPGLGDFAALVGLNLPDEDDRHVVAAALAAEAEFICTHDVGDFPAEVMNVLGLTVVTPMTCCARWSRTIRTPCCGSTDKRWLSYPVPPTSPRWRHYARPALIEPLRSCLGRFG